MRRAVSCTRRACRRAKLHDAKVMVNLIREDDRAVYGDKGYASDEKKRAAEGAGVLWAVKEKAGSGAARSHQKRQRARNRRFGKVLANCRTPSWRRENASSAIARSTIAGPRKTVPHRCSRSSRSPDLYLARGRLASA